MLNGFIHTFIKKLTIIMYNVRYRLGLAAEKREVPPACLSLYWDMTTRDGGSMEREEWRDILGYVGLYQVSNFGRVKSLERVVSYGNTRYVKPEKPMKIHVGKNHYCRVTLTKDGHQEQRYIHRLVAEAFLPNDGNLPEVDHIDANPSNNTIQNLRWVSHEENMRHILELGRNYDGTENITGGKYAKRRAVVRSDGKCYDSIIDAARDLGYKTNFCVWNNLNGNSDSCKGFTFRYADAM